MNEILKARKEKDLEEAKEAHDKLQDEYDVSLQTASEKEKASGVFRSQMVLCLTLMITLDMKKVGVLKETIMSLRLEIRYAPSLSYTYCFFRDLQVKQKAQGLTNDEDFHLKSKRADLEASRARLFAIQIKWSLPATDEAPLAALEGQEEEVEAEAPITEVKENLEGGSLFSGLMMNEPAPVENNTGEVEEEEKADDQEETTEPEVVVKEMEIEEKQEKVEEEEEEECVEAKKNKLAAEKAAKEDELQVVMTSVQKLEEDMLVLVEKDLTDEELEQCGMSQTQPALSF